MKCSKAESSQSDPHWIVNGPQIDRWRGIFEGRAPKKRRDSFCSWPQNQKDRFAQRQDAWKWVLEEVWLVFNAAHLRKKEGRASSLPHWGLQISSVGHRWDVNRGMWTEGWRQPQDREPRAEHPDCLRKWLSVATCWSLYVIIWVSGKLQVIHCLQWTKTQGMNNKAHRNVPHMVQSFDLLFLSSLTQFQTLLLSSHPQGYIGTHTDTNTDTHHHTYVYILSLSLLASGN